MATQYNYADELSMLQAITNVKGLLDKKVDAVVGKVLSDNNYSDEEKMKLADLVKIVVDAALSETSTNPVENRAVYTELAKKAPLLNANFMGVTTAQTPNEGNNSTQIATTEFVTRAIANAFVADGGLKIEVLTELPETGESGILYFVSNNSEQKGNAYDEYVWVNNQFEFIGTTAVDLEGYVKEEQLVPITTAEIDAMFG